MNEILQIVLIVGTLLFGAVILYFLVKEKLHLKYSLIWLLADFVMLLAALFPSVIGKIALLTGIKTPSNFIFVVYGLFVLLILLVLTGIVSHMNLRIFRLVQTQALLEERIRRLEGKNGCQNMPDHHMLNKKGNGTDE